MSIPCQDNHSTTFSSFADMMDYHQTQTKNSRWERVKVAELEVIPLGKAPILDPSFGVFAPGVSHEAAEDAMNGLSLAMRVNGEIYPLRNTAFKSLLDRAKISGTVLPKLDRTILANLLTHCFSYFKSEALLLIRDEKVSAVHSGDERDYSVLPIDGLLDCLHKKLTDRFAGNVFGSGYADHSLAFCEWSLPDQKNDLLEAYNNELVAGGHLAYANKLIPSIRFATSDVGLSSAKVVAMLDGLSAPIQLGTALETMHRSQSKVEDFDAAVDMLFAKFGDIVSKLQALLSVYLSNPVNAMIGVCKKLSMPKKEAMEAVEMFEFSVSGVATAHDVFMAMQEIPFLLKAHNMPVSKLLFVQECLARALAIDWSQYDTAKAVGF